MAIGIKSPRVTTYRCSESKPKTAKRPSTAILGGPSIAREDRPLQGRTHPYCHSWSGGTIYDDIDGPLGPSMSS